MGLFRESALPAKYYETPSGSGTTAGRGTPAGRGTAAGQPGGGALPPPEQTQPGGGRPPPAQPPPGQRTGQVRAPPSHVDQAWTGIVLDRGFDVPAHITAHPEVPVNDRGGQMCLSYHKRGFCRHECPRGPQAGVQNDHKKHSRAEVQRCHAYLGDAAGADLPAAAAAAAGGGGG